MATVKKPIKSYNPNKTKAQAMASARAKENMKKKSLGQSTQSKALVLEKPKTKPLVLEDPTKYQKDLFNMSKQDFNNKYGRGAHNKAKKTFVPGQVNQQKNRTNNVDIPKQQVNSPAILPGNTRSPINYNNTSPVPNVPINMINGVPTVAGTRQNPMIRTQYNVPQTGLNKVAGNSYLGGVINIAGQNRASYTDGVYLYNFMGQIIGRKQ